MSYLKKIIPAIVLIFIVIQFVQPARNTNGQVLATDVTKVVSVPETVQTILKNACYDCHSNNTIYPIYAYIQPVGWLLNNHIQAGKKQLNFSEFGAMTKRRQESKLKSIASQIKNEVMPLPSYTMLYKNAVLSKADRDLIINWANAAKDDLSK